MQREGLFGIPELGRFGLGHRLLAWARCVIWCRDMGAGMLAPNWYNVSVGPWIRRERDKRLYFRQFRSSAYIHGVRRLTILAKANRIDPARSLDTCRPSTKGMQLAVFRNSTSGDAVRFFPTFPGHHELLLNELRRMTRPRFLPSPSSRAHIAIHVRLGDFTERDPVQLLSGVHNSRLPIDWYEEMLIGIRGRLGADIPAVIYSDGSDSELVSLLVLKNVSRAPDEPAITHMLKIAQATLLIGTGSGMSLWGSLLGQVPRLCFPGQRLVSTLGAEIFEAECNSRQDFPEDFLSCIRQRLALSR